MTILVEARNKMMLQRQPSLYKSVLVDGLAWLSLLGMAVCAVMVCAQYASTPFINSSSSSNVLYDHRRLQEEESYEDLSVNITFKDIESLTIFIAVAWLLGNGVTWLGLPTLVGEIIAGCLLGPPLANFCPFPQAMVLIGNFGLIGLMLESGIHLDISQLKETGKRAVFLAVSGTCLALGTGFAMGALTNSGSLDFASSMAVGAAFAPSSLGVAATVLSAGQVLNTPTGQLIVASSVVDDVLGLILLSILNVFVMEDPTAVDFIRPFLASFGYLIVLGYAGITLIPYWIENWLLPRVPAKHQEKAVFCVLFGLLILYLPVLNYSGASYLTGAFLAGLSVSQVPLVHVSYAKKGRELMVWLMRIFFAATIGFQVPVRKFQELNVLRWGGIFVVPVLAKIPVGLLVPRFHHKVPHDFPFDPYWRDVQIASLSMVCRGEFNFIVASFGLSQGLVGPDIYSAIVFAVLLSCIVAPLALSRVIARYNKLSQDYLTTPHAVTRVNQTSPDGYRPLFVAIQVRAPIQYGLHETLQQALEGIGLIFLDHRSWHTNGTRDAVDISEIFAQDTKTRVRVLGCFEDGKDEEEPVLLRDNLKELHDEASDEHTNSGSASDSNSSLAKEIDHEVMSIVSNVGSERPPPVELMADDVQLVSLEQEIEERLFQIRKVLFGCLDTKDTTAFAIQVTQWQPFLAEDGIPMDGQRPATRSRSRSYTFHSNPHIGAGISEVENLGIAASGSGEPQSVATSLDCDLGVSSPPAVIGRQQSGVSSTQPPLSCDQHHCAQPNLSEDLWATDEVAHTCIRRHDLTWNPAVGGHWADEADEEAFFHHTPTEGGIPTIITHLDEEKETHTIQDRLHGYVRHH